MKPVIFGIAGEELSAGERAFFRESAPAGYILFKRNISNRLQTLRLTDDLRALSGRNDLPILIDQEGGRVARLQPPEWAHFPSGAQFDTLYRRAPMSAIAAARHNAEALALTLVEVGISVNCAPALDLRHAATHDAIGDRALGSSAMQVASLGRAMIDGFSAGGTVSVLKHAPGQGRATLDTHHNLPRVDASADALMEDMMPFKSLSHAPMMMTGHVVYTAWDADHPATLSRKVIQDVIRTEIGFHGLLLSDDLTMNALSGPVEARVVQALAAGCDIGLHCSADMTEMAAIAATAPDISSDTQHRLSVAMASYRPQFDAEKLASVCAARDQLLGLAA
jgi:beta-N-acetylhexosaminidase